MPDDSAAAGTGGVDDLDGRALREAVTGLAQQGLSTARDRYRVAYQWCITHPPADEYDVATLGDAGLPGLRDCDTRVGGDGTPGVSSLAVTEYAALAGISPAAGIQVLSDTLDLHHRLPGHPVPDPTHWVGPPACPGLPGAFDTAHRPRSSAGRAAVHIQQRATQQRGCSMTEPQGPPLGVLVPGVASGEVRQNDPKHGVPHPWEAVLSYFSGRWA